MEYVVTSKRLKNYLYTLGFDYREVPDKTQKQEFVWLFKNTDLLKEAIIFFSQQKKKMIASKISLSYST